MSVWRFFVNDSVSFRYEPIDEDDGRQRLSDDGR